MLFCHLIYFIAGTVPKPKITKDTEILVRVKAAAINPADFMYTKGEYVFKPTSFPSQLGFEGAGIIEEIGKATGISLYEHPQVLTHYQEAMPKVRKFTFSIWGAGRNILL